MVASKLKVLYPHSTVKDSLLSKAVNKAVCSSLRSNFRKFLWRVSAIFWQGEWQELSQPPSPARSLEVVKTQLQSRANNAGLGLSPLAVATKIVQKEGIKGLCRGLTPTMVGIVPTRSCYFWAYSAAKNALSTIIGEGPLTHMASAVAAGGLSNMVTCPLWMVKTRMQLNGGVLVATTQRIIREEGVKGLHRGLLASYWGLSEGAIQFLLYEHMKHELGRRNAAAAATTTTTTGNNNARSMPSSASDAPPAAAAAKGKAPALTTAQYLVSAGLSKGIASVFTYPHEVVRTRMREAAGGGRYRGMLQSLSLIAREEGRRGLYGGLGPHLMRVIPNTAIMFVSYELLSRHLPAILENPGELIGKVVAAPRRARDAAAAAAGKMAAAAAATATAVGVGGGGVVWPAATAAAAAEAAAAAAVGPFRLAQSAL